VIPSRAWRRAAGIAVVAAAAFYLIRIITGQWQQLQAFEWRVHPGLLAASVAAHVLVLTWGVWVWSRVLRHFEEPLVTQPVLQRIWFLSNLARYVPGKVFQFVAAAQLSRAAGLSAAVMLTSMLVHAGFALLSAVIVAVWTLGSPTDALPWTAIAVSGGALLTVHPLVLNRAIGVMPWLLRREVIRWTGTWFDAFRLLALSVLSWMLYGAAYHLFLTALAEVPWRLFPQMAGVNALSFFVGYVSILPGGIGLREVTMTELLRAYLPAGVSAVLALSSRLWTIAAELIGGAAAVALAQRAQPSSSEDTPRAEL
jgi:glycosyltransferase 2 family protein